MCVIIDVNAIPSVFSEAADGYEDFVPLRNWISKKRVRIVRGGTAYRKHAKGLFKKYMRLASLFRQFNIAGQLLDVADEEVDRKEKELLTLINEKGFDDHYLIALAVVSKTKLICSKNTHHHAVMRKKKFYPDGNPPRVYCKLSHGDVFNQKDFLNNCGPCKNNH